MTGGWELATVAWLPAFHPARYIKMPNPVTPPAINSVRSHVRAISESPLATLPSRYRVSALSRFRYPIFYQTDFPYN